MKRALIVSAVSLSAFLSACGPGSAGAAPLQVARVQYRYADYVATVTAANLPQTGLSVREQYMSAHL